MNHQPVIIVSDIHFRKPQYLNHRNLQAEGLLDRTLVGLCIDIDLTKRPPNGTRGLHPFTHQTWIL